MLASVVLMAGYSRRMGKMKQHVVLNGKTFLSQIIEKLSAFNKKIVTNIFVGQETDDLGREQVEDFGGIWVINHNPDNGPISSIRLALDKVPSFSGIMLWPIDHPMIGLNTIDLLLKEFENNPDYIILPSDGNHRGHPAIFPNWCFDYFKNYKMENGAKTLLGMFPDKIKYVLTDDVWITRNLNTPELLKEARQILS